MRRYWVDGANETQSEVYISGEEFHHIVDVCRQTVGAKFEILTAKGFALFVELKSITRKNAVAEVISRRKMEDLKKPLIHLALSVPKLATFESVIEKSVELGVYKIWPFLSDYSFFKTQKKIMDEKNNRFQKIIKSATQQSARASLMELGAASDFETVLNLYQNHPHSFGIFAYEGVGGKPLQSIFDDSFKNIENIWLFVGSEGGFSMKEVEQFKNNNLFPVSLGHQVLRVETACVTLLGVIKYEMNLF